MRKTYLFVAALLVAFPLLASAQHFDDRHRQPTPTPPVATSTPPVATTTPPVATTTSSGSYMNCANVGYLPLVNGKYNLTQTAAELTALKAKGINCVRNGAYGPNPTWAYPLYQQEVSMGFYVTVTADSDPTAKTYAPALVAFATWAQANGVKSFGVGNEDAKTQSMVNTIDNLSCQVAQVFHGQISYDTYLADPGQFDEIKAYAQNKGCLTELGLNIYAAYPTTFAEAQQYWGNNWFASEIGMDCDAFNCTSDSTRANYMKTNIIPSLSKYSVQAYWFSFDAGGDGVPTKWAVQNEPLTMGVI